MWAALRVCAPQLHQSRYHLWRTSWSQPQDHQSDATQMGLILAWILAALCRPPERHRRTTQIRDMIKAMFEAQAVAPTQPYRLNLCDQNALTLAAAYHQRKTSPSCPGEVTFCWHCRSGLRHNWTNNSPLCLPIHAQDLLQSIYPPSELQIRCSGYRYRSGEVFISPTMIFSQPIYAVSDPALP